MRILLAALASFALLSGGTVAAGPGKAKGHSPNGSAAGHASYRFSQVSGSTWYYLWITGPSGSVHTAWYDASNLPCGGGSCTIDPKLNLPNGHYTWWVQTWDPTGTGPWSDGMEFDVGGGAPQLPAVPFSTVLWIDHLAFQPGTPSVSVSFDAVDSGVGSGTSGLIVEAAPGPNPRSVEQGLLVPPGMLVDGVRVCYELSDPQSFISQIRLEQLDDPPDQTQTLLADATGLRSAGPVCVDSASPAQPIDASTGSVRLQLGLAFPDPTASDRIVIRGVGLHVVADPNGPFQQEIHAIWQRLDHLETTLGGHVHHYLTGKGVGHNNTNATTGSPIP